jgi:hypothetical protein
MLQEASTSEMSANFYQTAWHKKPENCELQVKIRLNSLRIRV